MARLTIQVFLHEGGKTYRIALLSDEDATPLEHEREHRRFVRSLLPGIDLDRDNLPRIRIEREAPVVEPPPPCSSDDGGYEVIDLG